jgi:phosphatidylserine/phosphatidylglycerophosphate/cardiolipin synthase-like enzyme
MRTRPVALAVSLIAAFATACMSPSVPGAVPDAAASAQVTVPVGPATAPEAGTQTDPRRVVTSGCNESPEVTVCFSSPPTQGGTDNAVFKAWGDVFRSAGAGDTLRIAMFRWDVPGTAKALIKAQQRGARVELVVDDDVLTWRDSTVGRNLVRTIERTDTKRKNVTVCQGSCLPWRAPGPYPTLQNVNHHKTIVGKIDGQEFVATSSANLEGRQLPQYNSLVIVRDAGLYRFGLDYFKRLKAKSLTINGNTWNDRSKGYASSRIAAAAYPRRTDLLLNTLRRVECVRGANEITVLVAVLQRHDIRTELGRLHKSGCHIRMVVTRDLIQNWLEAPGRLPDGTTFDIPNNRVKTVHLHDKAYTIHAKFRGKVRYLTITGTSNTTCGGLLYNDELMMRLEGKWVHDVYRAHFEDAWSHGTQSTVTTVPEQARCG